MQNGLAQPVQKSRKQQKERKNRTKAIRGVKKNAGALGLPAGLQAARLAAIGSAGWGSALYHRVPGNGRSLQAFGSGHSMQAAIACTGLCLPAVARSPNLLQHSNDACCPHHPPPCSGWQEVSAAQRAAPAQPVIDLPREAFFSSRLSAAQQSRHRQVARQAEKAGESAKEAPLGLEQLMYRFLRTSMQELRILFLGRRCGGCQSGHNQLLPQGCLCLPQGEPT